MTAWLDRLAADLLHVEEDLRTTLRIMSRGGHPRRDTGWHRLEISTAEARTLLRGAMPVPVGSTKLRQPHARMMAALGQFSAHMLALNDPLWSPQTAQAAAAALIEELRTWLRITQWQAATRRAKVKWPRPDLSITTLARSQTAEQVFTVGPFKGQPRPAEDLPNAYAGRLHHPSLSLSLRRLRVEQAELDLGPPVAAEVVDLRQLRLDLVPPAQETTRDRSAA